MQGSNTQRRPSTIADESSHDGRHRVEVGQLEEQLEERTAGRTEEDFATSYFLDAGLNIQPQSVSPSGQLRTAGGYKLNAIWLLHTESPVISSRSIDP